jgi:hypothetical protein
VEEIKNMPESKQSPPTPTIETPCHVCGYIKWWLRDNKWICGICHPNPNKKGKDNA